MGLHNVGGTEIDVGGTEIELRFSHLDRRNLLRD